MKKITEKDMVTIHGLQVWVPTIVEWNYIMMGGNPTNANADIPVTINGVTKSLKEWYEYVEPTQAPEAPVTPENKVIPTIEMSEFMAANILSFCENAAELGCPSDRDVDMWFRELSADEMVKVAQHLCDIIHRDNERFGKDALDESDFLEVPEDVVEKKVFRVTLDIPREDYERLVRIGRSQIVNDDQACFEYAAVNALKQMLDMKDKTE